MASSADLSSPTLLLAMPQVLDPFFHKSVVLLIHHEDDGSVGFIVNRPTGIRVSEILQGMEVAWQGPERAVAHFGGPVQPQLGTVLYAPRTGDPEGSGDVVIPGVSLTRHVGDLAELAADPPERFRLFLGYAGWGAGQLMQEILRNDWLTAPVQSDLIFAPAAEPEQAWEAALKSVGVHLGALPNWTTPREGWWCAATRSSSSPPRTAAAGSSPRATWRRARRRSRRRCARCARRPG
jgi:putative transcriptional regulator